MGSDIQVNTYDNAITARTYISYIAEQAGGFACIGRDGKLYIKMIGENIIEVPFEYFEKYSWGEECLISRIHYEDGIRVLEKGNETNNTLYISSDNMFIVDQTQIDNIYGEINNLSICSFEGDSIIDPAIDIGDILVINDKQVVYQGSCQYIKRWKANISSKIQCKAKEETTVKKESQIAINRRLQSTIDKTNGEITLLAQETSEISEEISKIEMSIGSIDLEVKKKVNTSDYTSANILLMINDDTSEAQIKADKISLEGKTINLTGDNVSITSNNFSVDEDGNVTASNVNITGGNINLKSNENTNPSIVIGDPDNTQTYTQIYSGIIRGYLNGSLRTQFYLSTGLLGLTTSDGSRTTHAGGVSSYRDSNDNEVVQISTLGIQTTKNITTGNKATSFDGNTGCLLTNYGGLQLSRASSDGNPYVALCYNNATSATSQWTGIGSQTSNISGYLNINSNSSQTDYRLNVNGHARIAENLYVRNNIYLEYYLYNNRQNNVVIEIQQADSKKVYYGPWGTNSITSYLRGHDVRMYAQGGGVYLGNSGSTAVTSDENLKNITDIDDRYINFYKSIKPIKYIYKLKGHRTHLGFGARQIEQSLINSGLTTEEFAGILIDKDFTVYADENGTGEDIHYNELYSLRYEEFIALNTYMIQKLFKHNEEQARQIKDLKERMNKYEQTT